MPLHRSSQPHARHAHAQPQASAAAGFPPHRLQRLDIGLQHLAQGIGQRIGESTGLTALGDSVAECG
jgi:hypothetical protein